MIVDGVRRDKRRKRESDEVIEVMQNLVGDGDLDQQSGLIEVDRSEPLHPVIRFRNDRLMESGWIVPPSVTTVVGAGCYELVDVEETKNGETVINKYLANQYYIDGAVLKLTNFTDPLRPETHYDKFLAVRVPMTASGSTTLQAYATYADMHTASLDRAYVILPLYQLDANGDIVCDFRNAPRVQAVEVLS